MTSFYQSLRMRSPRNPAFEAKHPRDQFGQFTENWLGTAAARIGLAHLRTEQTIRDLHSYRHPNGWHVQVSEITTRPNDPYSPILVECDVKDADGNDIGTINTIIHDRQGHIHLDYIELNEEGPDGKPAKGQGFITGWLADYERRAYAEGIRGLTLHADIDVGVYAWAKLGFDFATQNDEAAVAIRFATKIDRYDQSVKDQFLALFRRKGTVPSTTPLEWAMIGWEPGLTMWPGKEMLLGSDWDGWMGVKRLHG